MRGMRRDESYGARRFRAGEWECEACGWAPPKWMGRRAMHVHHIVPRACGGDNRDNNLILLCPNCHSLAHVIGKMPRRRKRGGWGIAISWTGAQDRWELLRALDEAFEAQKSNQSCHLANN